MSRDADDPADPGTPPSPPAKLFDPTTIDELLELAAALLADEAAGRALLRVGVHGDFTPEEKAAVEKVLVDHVSRKGWRGSIPNAAVSEEFARLVPLPPRDCTRDPLLLNLSVTLARWIAGGTIPDIETPQARAFLEDRFFTRSADRGGLLTKKATATEVLWLARALKANPTYWSIVEKAGEFGEIDDDVSLSIMQPIEHAIIVKYGLIDRTVFVGAHSVLRKIAAGNIDSLDAPAALDFIRQFTVFVRD